MIRVIVIFRLDGPHSEIRERRLNELSRVMRTDRGDLSGQINFGCPLFPYLKRVRIALTRGSG